MSDLPDFSNISRFLVVLIPIALIQLGLMLAALIHLLKRNKVRSGSVGIWIAIIVLINIIGPILYFTIGREES